jgi:hypothetical protein
MMRTCSLRPPSAPNRSPDLVRCVGRLSLPAEIVIVTKDVSRIIYNFCDNLCDTIKSRQCKHFLILSLLSLNTLVFSMIACVTTDINSHITSLSWVIRTMM